MYGIEENRPGSGLFSLIPYSKMLTTRVNEISDPYLRSHGALKKGGAYALTGAELRLSGARELSSSTNMPLELRTQRHITSPSH